MRSIESESKKGVRASQTAARLREGPCQSCLRLSGINYLDGQLSERLQELSIFADDYLYIQRLSVSRDDGVALSATLLYVESLVQAALAPNSIQ